MRGTHLRAFNGVQNLVDHPRACGEHCDHIQTRAFLLGIIPAHAGNTSSLAWPRASSRDHPRACGEHFDGDTGVFRFRGSSPRMRGTQDALAENKNIVRIIPAHAGNTRRPSSPTSGAGDHPRACGEHPFRGLSQAFLTGSSPRMRGTLIDRITHVSNLGIIPAHAGNTGVAMADTDTIEDHPRACGEHHRHAQPDFGTAGSSPRMRGTHS